MRPISFKRHRFPSEIIRHAIWLYARFTLSFRDVEELLAERGIDASYETVRRWFLKFGPSIAANIRRSRPRPSDHWHLDEMVISIRGGKYWLWRAVDNEGEVLDFLVQRKRDAQAATKLMVKLLKKQGFAPSRVVTDRLRSYPVAFRAIGLTAEHDRGLRANNRAENSHQPIRRRERKLQRFKSPGSVQRFLAIHAATFNAFTHQRHLLRRPHFKELRAGSFRTWAKYGTGFKTWLTRPGAALRDGRLAISAQKAQGGGITAGAVTRRDCEQKTPACGRKQWALLVLPPVCLIQSCLPPSSGHLTPPGQ